MKLSAATLAKPTKFFIMRGDDDDFDHRAEIIRMVCEFELLLTEKSLAWLEIHNPHLDREQTQKEFFEEGPISSLKKHADFAFTVGIIGNKTPD